MLARARVDARDPERARAALLLLAPPVRVLQRLLRLLARHLDAAAGLAAEALGELPDQAAAEAAHLCLF